MRSRCLACLVQAVIGQATLWPPGLPAGADLALPQPARDCGAQLQVGTAGHSRAADAAAAAGAHRCGASGASWAASLHAVCSVHGPPARAQPAAMPRQPVHGLPGLPCPVHRSAASVYRMLLLDVLLYGLLLWYLDKARGRQGVAPPLRARCALYSPSRPSRSPAVAAAWEHVASGSPPASPVHCPAARAGLAGSSCFT